MCSGCALGVCVLQAVLREGPGVLGDQCLVGRVLDDHDAHVDAERHLDQQEQRHDHDQHQRPARAA